MGSFSLLAAALLALGGGGHARGNPKLPLPTPSGLMADRGISPVPTDPPNFPRGIPYELAQRAATEAEIPYPPPGYYCGLVEGDAANPLTCIDARFNCIYTGQAVGCCLSRDISDCSKIPTTCVPSRAPCDASCQSDPRRLRCTVGTLPYCQTYDFGDGTQLYNCHSVDSMTWQVQWMAEYYSSALGPDYTTLGPSLPTESTSEPDDPSTTIEPTAEGGGVQQGDASTTPTPSGSDDDNDDGGGGGGGGGGSSLSGGAIAGIVIGAVAVVAALAAFIAWLLIVKRKQQNNAGPGAGQQQQQQPQQQPQQPQPPPSQAGPFPQQPPVAQIHDPSQHGGASFFAPVEAKNVNDPPGYATYDPSYQPHSPAMPPAGSTASPVPEMPGSPMQHPASNPASTPTSPQPPQSPQPAPQPQPPSNPQMAATHAGPVPDQVHEMGTGR